MTNLQKDSPKFSHTLICLIHYCIYIDYHHKLYYNYRDQMSILSFLFSVFETVSTSAAEANAYHRAALARTWQQKPEHTLLFPIGSDSYWGNDKQVARGEKLISQHTASEHIALKLPKRTSEFFDQDYMSAFLRNSNLGALTYNSECYSIRQLMPNFCSLLDLVSVDSRRLDSWCVSKDGAPPSELFKVFQKTKGLSMRLLDKVEVKEIRVGTDSELTIKQVTDWAKQQWCKDQETCPTDTISMDVEAIQILKSDLDRVMANTASDKTPLSIYVKNIRGQHLKKGEATQLPVRIMLGNGYTWALMITLVAAPVAKGQMLVESPTFQPELLKYLKGLPRLVGVGIRADVMQIEDLIRSTSDQEFRFAGCVDISSMAVLAGWNFRFSNMQALSVQAMGAFLNKSVSCGDGRWGCKWRHIPDSLKVYCLGDVKFGHQATVLFLTILLRDMFPDPDIVLSFLRNDGHNVMKWFASWVADTLQNVELNPRASVAAKSRTELLYSLRFRRRNNTMADSPPARVVVFSQLLGQWPSVTFGGPRYLHQVRKHFLIQEAIFRGSEVEQWKKIMPYEVTFRMECSAMYALPGLSSLDYTVPAMSSPQGLGVHPGLEHLMLSGEDLSSEAVRKSAEVYERVRREVIYEWVRLNLNETQRFLDGLVGDAYYSQYIRSYLLETQMIFLRCTGQQPPDVPELSELVAAKSRSLAAEERKYVEQVEELLKRRKLRLKFFEFWGASAERKTVTSLSWRGEIPKVTPCTDRNRCPSYMDDFRPVAFYKEVDEIVSSDAGIPPNSFTKSSSREYDEKRSSDEPAGPSKRQKTSKKMMPVPEWAVEEEKSYDDIPDLVLNNSITDAEPFWTIE